MLPAKKKWFSAVPHDGVKLPTKLPAAWKAK